LIKVRKDFMSVSSVVTRAVAASSTPAIIVWALPGIDSLPVRVRPHAESDSGPGGFNPKVGKAAEPAEPTATQGD
jgi:hypothetical protein